MYNISNIFQTWVNNIEKINLPLLRDEVYPNNKNNNNSNNNNSLLDGNDIQDLTDQERNKLVYTIINSLSTLNDTNINLHEIDIITLLEKLKARKQDLACNTMEEFINQYSLDIRTHAPPSILYHYQHDGPDLKSLMRTVEFTKLFQNRIFLDHVPTPNRPIYLLFKQIIKKISPHDGKVSFQQLSINTKQKQLDDELKQKQKQYKWILMDDDNNNFLSIVHRTYKNLLLNEQERIPNLQQYLMDINYLKQTELDATERVENYIKQQMNINNNGIDEADINKRTIERNNRILLIKQDLIKTQTKIIEQIDSFDVEDYKKLIIEEKNRCIGLINVTIELEGYKIKYTELKKKEYNDMIKNIFQTIYSLCEGVYKLISSKQHAVFRTTPEHKYISQLFHECLLEYKMEEEAKGGEEDQKEEGEDLKVDVLENFLIEKDKRTSTILFYDQLLATITSKGWTITTWYSDWKRDARRFVKDYIIPENSLNNIIEFWKSCNIIEQQISITTLPTKIKHLKLIIGEFQSHISKIKRVINDIITNYEKKYIILENKIIQSTVPIQYMNDIIPSSWFHINDFLVGNNSINQLKSQLNEELKNELTKDIATKKSKALTDMEEVDTTTNIKYSTIEPFILVLHYMSIINKKNNTRKRKLHRYHHEEAEVVEEGDEDDDETTE
jgi:hypothetical protein